MKKSKNSNWILIGAFMFFLVSAGFTTTANANQEVSSSGLCWVCGAYGCTFQAGDQYGRVDCFGGNPCYLIGAVCGGPGGDPE